MSTGSRAVALLFAALALAAAAGAVDAIERAVAGSGLRDWLLADYSLLRTGVVVSFTLFVLTRGPARRKSREPIAFLACAAAIGSVVALRAPADSAPESLVVAGELVALASVAWLLWAVLALGKCFGVLPEARGLVTKGPYRIVRHPMYLGELGACAGLVIASAQAWNVGAAAIFAAAQAIRMSLEERALTREFPDYARYASTTARLIPGLARSSGTRPQAENA